MLERDKHRKIIHSMNIVKIDRSATSQSVRLPDEFQFDVDEVEIFRRGDEVILRKKRKTLKEAFDLLASMPEDFFAEERQDPPPEVYREMKGLRGES